MQRFTLLVLFSLLSLLSRAQSPASIVRDMIDSSAKLEGFRAEITKEERFNGKIIKQISAVKLQKSPYKLYLNQRYPKEGVEVLVRNLEDKPLINPNAFPWFNLNLDPYGSLMRKNQHHTVYDSGFDLMVAILERELAQIGADTADYISYIGVVEWDNRPAHHIELTYENYGKQHYRVQMGEDLNVIAKKLNINEYDIVELNKDVDFYDDVEPGQDILVPTTYAKKMVLYIDKGYMLPLVIKVYDEKGLYEQYGYHNFVLNPNFEDGEFKSDYKDYGF